VYRPSGETNLPVKESSRELQVPSKTKTQATFSSAFVVASTCSLSSLHQLHDRNLERRQTHRKKNNVRLSTALLPREQHRREVEVVRVGAEDEALLAWEPGRNLGRSINEVPLYRGMISQWILGYVSSSQPCVPLD